MGNEVYRRAYAQRLQGQNKKGPDARPFLICLM